MYQFRTGIMYSKNLTANGAIVAGQPVAVNSSAQLTVAADDAVIDGVATTTVATGDYIGLQTAGFCGTNQIDGTAGGATLGPIAFGDSLEVNSGLFIKRAAGAIVAKAWCDVDADQSADETELFDIEIL